MQNSRTDGRKKNARKTSRDADYEDDSTAYDSYENSANSPETKPIRGSRYDPPTSPKSVMMRVRQVRRLVRKKVRKAGTQNEECAPQNRTKKRTS